MVSILQKKKMNNLKSRMELKHYNTHVKWICKSIKCCLLGLSQPVESPVSLKTTLFINSHFLFIWLQSIPDF